MLRTGNPALGEKTFSEARSAASGAVMTVQGVVNRTALLLFILIAAAVWVWKIFADAGGMSGNVELLPVAAQAVMLYIWGGLIGGLVLALVTIFAKRAAFITAPAYALCEGLFIGGISAFLESQFHGIALQAAGLTFGTLFILLLVYSLGIIKATENFKLGVIAATGGIALVYVATIILGFFGVGVPYIHGSGTIGIAFSVFVVVIAALNLVLDFDFIERGAAAGAPKYLEWYGAFGLLVTLVWLYIEILRLLAKLRSRR